MSMSVICILEQMEIAKNAKYSMSKISTLKTKCLLSDISAVTDAVYMSQSGFIHVMQCVWDGLRLNVPASIFGVSSMLLVCVSGLWWATIWCVR